MDLIDAPFYGDVAAGLMAIGTLLYAAFRWSNRFRRWLARVNSAVSGLLDIGAQSGELLANLQRTGEIDGMLRQVKHEVMPNGGTSLRDAVNRTESTMNLVVGQMRAHADADDDVARLDCNGKGEVEWLARSLMMWTERTSDELKGFGWLSSVHPDHREDVAEEFRHCIQHRRQFDSAFRLINRSGDVTMVRASFAPVVTRRQGDEETVRWVGTIRRVNVLVEGLAPPERSAP